MGAATTNENVSEAALPFDDRRHGLIIGSARGLIVERRGISARARHEPIAVIESGIIANSGITVSRLDVDQISFGYGEHDFKWEKQSGLSRDELTKNAFFMSMKPILPKRGGSGPQKFRALRDTFGDKARLISIAKTQRVSRPHYGCRH